jgi:hypothetical protein
MEKRFFAALAVAVIAFAACNSSGDKTKNEGMADMKKDSVPHVTTADNKEIKTVAIIYTNVDTKAAASLNEIVNHYLQVKNALANDNGSEAASGGKAMEEAIRKMDKSLLTAEQKKVYDDIEDDLKEHAGHIGRNGDNIKHQREHFSMMSEDIYDLVRAFGGGQALYHDHCPMYNKDKGGAMWLSEMEEVKNPYYGAEMPACGTVEELIK